MTVIEAMNEGQRPGLKDITNGIVEKLGFGPSKTELIEQRIIPEIFALAGETTSSEHQLKIPNPLGKEGEPPQELTLVSMRRLDLTRVLPDFQTEKGRKPALEEIVGALEHLSGKRAIQEAKGVSKRMRERLGPQDLYIFIVLVNGEPKNISYITRRGAVKIGVGLLSGGILTACADALRRMSPPPTGSLSPPGVSTQKEVDQTPAPTPEAFRTVSIQDAVPAFSEARQLQIGSEGFYVSASSATEEKIRADRISETQFTFGEPGQQVHIDFKKDAVVDVGLSFGGAQRPVVSHGMVSILDPADSLTLKYIRQSLGVSEAETLSFAGGSGVGDESPGGVPLRGMSLMYSVTTPQETEPAGWIFSPWLTSSSVIAENETKSGGPYISYYKSDGNGKSEFLSSVPLKDLLVRMDTHQKLVVSSDGRYMLDNGDNTFALVSDVWRKQGVPEDVISYYETLFVPAVSAEEWASDTETGQVKPENMFPLVGAINHKNRYTLDLGFGTMRLAVAQDRDLAQTASHRDLRGIVGLDLDNNLELRKHLLTIRSNFAKLDEFKGKKDFKDLTLVIEGGIVTLAVLKLGDALRKYKVDNEGTITLLKKEEEPSLLPELYVDGAYIKRADTGEVISLKGLNISSFAYERERGSFDFIWQRGLKTITEQNWPVNVYRVGLNLDFYKDKLKEIDKLEAFAEEHGIYLIFTPHREGEDQPVLPSPKTADMMSELATRYKNKNNILYALFNEPAPDNLIRPWNEVTSRPQAIKLWRDAAQPIADAIRSVHSTAIIVVPGATNYANNLDDYIAHPFIAGGNTANIMYDVHDYGQEDNPDQKPFNNNKSLIRFVNQNQSPVLVGEMGGVTAGSPSAPKNGEKDIAYMEKAFDFIDSFPGKVHYTAWVADTWDDSGMLEPNNLTVLTNRGKVTLLNFQGTNGPYNFRN